LEKSSQYSDKVRELSSPDGQIGVEIESGCVAFTDSLSRAIAQYSCHIEDIVFISFGGISPGISLDSIINVNGTLTDSLRAAH
jgi:hypothetical protein